MKTKIEKSKDFEKNLKEPEEIEMFNISNYFNPQPGSIETSLCICVNEVTQNFIKSIGKEKEYFDYLENVNEILEPTFDKITDLTIEFANNNLANGKYERPKNDLPDEVKKEIMNLLKDCLFGGRN